MALAIILLTPVVLLRTPVDIFPDINIPVISLVWTYNGLQPQEMEQRITSNVERGVTTLVSDNDYSGATLISGGTVMPLRMSQWRWPSTCRSTVSTSALHFAAAARSISDLMKPRSRIT